MAASPRSGRFAMRSLLWQTHRPPPKPVTVSKPTRLKLSGRVSKGPVERLWR